MYNIYIYIYIYIGFPQCFLKTFNQKLITIHDGRAHRGVNRWLNEFFQSVDT